MAVFWLWLDCRSAKLIPPGPKNKLFWPWLHLPGTSRNSGAQKMWPTGMAKKHVNLGQHKSFSGQRNLRLPNISHFWRPELQFGPNKSSPCQHTNLAIFLDSIDIIYIISGAIE